ncbi:helix-turn-helix domain-containing protein [Rhodobacteraceae bacterium IMCC15231]|nr:helix-turn-helix domain-containing protein [Paracoccaceae bacterium]MED7678814.1 helix-turn-helix domain-containing protein [Rhodobacteraceae bacterium IMCC15231]
MTSENTPGARIRQARLAAGLKQAELAARAGISAPYLNLIEHDRRKIAGKLLIDLSKLLNVEATLLSQGAEAALITGLNDIAALLDAEAAVLPIDTADFAARFLPWANRLVALHGKYRELEHMVNAMADRLSHDPRLADSLFEVLSAATAIRSTSAILAETTNIEPEWQNRFHRNLNEDSRRLAAGAQALVGFLDPEDADQNNILSPREELDGLLAMQRYYFEEFEESGGDVTRRVEAFPQLSVQAQKLLQDYLAQYQKDALALPQTMLSRILNEFGTDPVEAARRSGQALPVVMRRMASLSAQVLNVEVGLLICDASGSVLFNKPVPGFKLPISAGFCAIWPVFEALQLPMRPIRLKLQQNGRGGGLFQSVSFAQLPEIPVRADPVLPVGYMLLQPHESLPQVPSAEMPHAQMSREVGLTCRLCTRADCFARREISVFAEEF